MMHSAGDENSLLSAFFISICQKMSYASAFFAVLRLGLKGSGTKNR